MRFDALIDILSFIFAKKRYGIIEKPKNDSQVLI